MSSYVAGMEMLATGTTCSLNHSVTTTTPDLVACLDRAAGASSASARSTPRNCAAGPPAIRSHPLSLDEALAAFEEEMQRWDGKSDGLVRFGMAIESNAHWVAAGMSTEELICRGYELAKQLGLQDHRRISPAARSRWKRAF